jgi:uncharacterized repeat protein (TIGR04052 family)
MNGQTRRRAAVALLVIGAACGEDAQRRENIDAGSNAPEGGPTERDAGEDAGEEADAAQDASVALQPVTIQFAARVGQSAFACGQRYADQGSTGVDAEPLDFRFYIQDLRLINAAGEEVPVQMDERLPWQTPEVALLDFENGEGRCHGNAETNDVITGKVPPGAYQGIAFRNGVPAALNHSNPATVPAPLQAPGVSWNWLSGFRFLLAELGQVASDAGAGGIGLLHVGSTACEGDPEAGSVSCARPNRNEIRLMNFDPARDQVVADLGAVFAHTDLGKAALCHSAAGGGHHAPPTSDAGSHEPDAGHGHEPDAGHLPGDGGTHNPGGHGGGNACAAMFPEVGLDLETGQPLATQALFRVE